MRTSSTFKPRFWTGGSGRKLRGNKPAQVLATYLMTSPHGNMIGLHYESLVSILHETGLTDAEFREAMPQIHEIALYDEEAGLVFLFNGAEHQIGETLSARDKKRPAILSQLKTYGKHPFVKEWIKRYYEPYNLAHDGIADPFAASLGSTTPTSHAPSKGHARVVHAPDPRSGSDPRSDPREKSDPGEEAPVVADLLTRAKVWVKDPFRASHQYPQPEQWSEMTELNELVADTFGSEPDTLTGFGRDGRLDPRVDVVLHRWAEGTDQARMREAIRGAAQDDLIRSKPTLQSLVTIFKDANAVDKYCRLAKSKQGPSPSKVNVERLTSEAAEARRKFREGRDL